MNSSRHTTHSTPRRSGLTLVEVIVAMGVALVAGTLMVRLYVVSSKGLDVQHQRVEQMRTVRTLLYDLKRDLRAAAGVLPQFQTYRSDEHTLVLALLGIDASGRAVRGWRDVVVYESTPAGVQRLIFPDHRSRRTPEQTGLTTGDTSLSFIYSGPDLTRCILVTAHVSDLRKIHRRESRFPASVTVRLRNHR